MTIAAQTAADNRTSAAGNGVTTSFSFPKPFTAQADLVVQLVLVASPYTATTQTLTTHYTISGTADTQGRYGSGANVVFLSAPSALYNVVIYADPSVAQGLDLVENDPLPAEQLELSYDKLTLLTRRTRDLLARTYRLPDSSVSAGTTTLEPVATTLLGFDASKNLVTYPAVSGISTAASVTFLSTATGAISRTANAKMQDLIARADFSSSALYETAMATAGTTLGYGLLGSLRINGKHVDDQAWLHVGDYDGSFSTDSAALVARDLTGAGNAHGFSDSSVWHRNAGTAYCAFDARGYVTGTANYDHVNCYQAQWTFSTSGTILLHAGFTYAPTVTAGSITQAVGLNFSQPLLSGGAAINSNYGILLGDFTAGSVNNYGIKIGDVAGGTAFSIYTGTGAISLGGTLDTRAGYISSESASNPFVRVYGSAVTSAAFQWYTNALLRWRAVVDSGASTMSWYSGTGAGTKVIEWDTSGNVAVGGVAQSATTALITPAGTTGVSSLRIPHGAAPTSPVNGDVWSTTTTLNFRLNGVTKSVTLT